MPAAAARLRPQRVARAGGAWLTALALVTLPGCGADPAPASRAAPAAAVVTDHATLRQYAEPIEAIGTARARDSVFITSRVSGRVSRIFLTEGARAARGDPIVLLEDDAERAAFRSAAAAAAEAQAQLERLETLGERGLVSRFERDRQRRAVETTQAELELNRVLLDQRTIRAPFDGVVGFRQVSPGSLVQPGTHIVSLDNCDEMRIQFSVPETLLTRVQPGAPVEAVSAAYAGRIFLGRIGTRGTRVDEVTRAVPVQAVFENADGSLLPGMLLTLRIRAQPRQLTSIPEAALAPDHARQFVWRVGADEAAQRVEVTIGAREPGWVEILSGIAAGDRVVVEGVDNLRPGVAVREVAVPTLASRRPRGS
jgi:membrane fusion protein (multidrug efflux system)